MKILHERLIKLRKYLHITQQEFADRLNVSRSTVATYEIGKSNPSDAAISLICREFNVNEDWLRDGIGEMFLPTNRNIDIAKLTKQFLNEEDDSFKNRFISMLANLSAEEWEFLKRKERELYRVYDKKTIPDNVKLLEYIDEDFIKIFTKLTEREKCTLKGVALGFLLGSGRYTPEQVADLSGFKRC